MSNTSDHPSYALAQSHASRSSFCLSGLFLLILGFGQSLIASNGFSGCTSPCGVGATNSPSQAGLSWSPTGRPHVLVTSWNTPVTGVDEMMPSPEPEGSGPVQVSLSQSVISNDFFGIIDLSIEGLSLGQTVLLEKFKVDNDQGQINVNAILQESHQITDGVAAMSGEVFNFNLVNDVTPRDGAIQSQLDFWEPDASSIVGEYVYRVSSPLSSFPATSVRLTVDEVTTLQRFVGQVTSEGQPVAGAIVALLNPIGNGSDFINGTTSDAQGNYILYAPEEDEYDILAIKPGFVSPFAAGTGDDISEGEDFIFNISLEQGSRNISGTLTDEDTNEPLAGVELFFFPTGAQGGTDFSHCTTTWTNAQGQFSVDVTPGRWGAIVRAQIASKIGYLTENALTPLAVADVTDENVTGLAVRLKKSTSLIWGVLLSDTLKTSGPGPFNSQPLSGVELSAYQPETGKEVWGVTDGNGQYRLAVTPGRWLVYPFTLSLEDSDHAATPFAELNLTADDQSIFHGFTCRFNSGTVTGNVTGPDGPLGRLLLSARDVDLDNQDVSFQNTFESDGFFAFDLPDGTWSLMPDPVQAAATGLVFEELPTITIVEGMPNGDDDDIDASFTAALPTAMIEVTLTGPDDEPLEGVYFHAQSENSLFECDSFAVTNALGVANIPAGSFTWVIHASSEYLRNVGMKALPEFTVSTGGEDASVSVQAEALTNEPAQMMPPSKGASDSMIVEGVGQAGQIYGIESSTDLKTWFRVGSLRASSAGFTVVDFPNVSEDAKYYRAVSSPIAQ